MSANDVIAIQKLLADYNHLIDSGQAESWADLFADGGTFDPGLMPEVSGRQALVDFAAVLPALIPGARHVLSNVSITVDDNGTTATSKAYLHLWTKDADGKVGVSMSGIYNDSLTKVGETWRFSRRAMTAD